MGHQLQYPSFEGNIVRFYSDLFLFIESTIPESTLVNYGQLNVNVFEWEQH